MFYCALIFPFHDSYIFVPHILEKIIFSKYLFLDFFLVMFICVSGQIAMCSFIQKDLFLLL
jgi:hypothetical protein